MLLDGAGGRYDVVVADPVCTVVTRGAVTEVARRGGAVHHTEAHPLEGLRAALGPLRPAPVPYAGGALGYLSYELGHRFEATGVASGAGAGWPEMAFGIYAWALVTDHHRRRSYLALRPGMGSDGWARLVERLRDGDRAWPRPAPAAAFSATGVLRTSLDRRAYARAFDRVAAYIREGDCYQVNLTLGFEVPVEGDPLSAYAWLRRRSPAPWGAFLGLPWGTVLSNSPEGFLTLEGGHVITRPIKGTRPRRGHPAADRAQIEALRASAKDRAENVMIVDLLRNDLGRVCRPGSVRVPHLCRVQTYANVHHLVSSVTGTLAPGRDALDLLRACFPGGSITGAPKRRAMQIIAELEPWPRGVYCGAIGWLGFDGDMSLNIAIRTAVHQPAGGGAILRFGAGGGIVADSQCDREYAECYDKASILLRLAGRPHPAASDPA